MAINNDLRAKKLRIVALDEAIPGLENRVVQMIYERAQLQAQVFKVEAHAHKEEGNGEGSS